MLEYIAIVLSLASLCICGFVIATHILTSKYLRKHQREWDEIAKKSKTLSYDERLQVELDYMKSLPEHWLVGKCYPRFKY